MTLLQAAAIYNKANKNKKRPVAIVKYQGRLYRVSNNDAVIRIDPLLSLQQKLINALRGIGNEPRTQSNMEW